MELPTLAVLVGWLCGAASDALRAWCRVKLLRWLGVADPADPPPAPPPGPGPAPSWGDRVLERLYDSVARYREGDRP